MNIDLEETQNMIERKLKRGEVYKCDLGYGIGSEMRKNAL